MLCLCAAAAIAASPGPRSESVAPITIDYPTDGSIFPPDMAPPTFLWRDAEASATHWKIEVKFAGGTVPVNAGVKSFGGPVVEKMVGFSGKLVTYLDWNWPPEVTRAFQEGIQGGVAGQVTAADAAASAQQALDQLVAKGYKFQQ